MPIKRLPLLQTHGTTVDGAPVPANKPTVMKDGATLRFGGGEDGPAYIVRCESSAEKRGRGDGEAAQTERKRGGAAGGGPTSVRASHLLVKHAGSRRPASWKVRRGAGGQAARPALPARPA